MSKGYVYSGVTLNLLVAFALRQVVFDDPGGRIAALLFNCTTMWQSHLVSAHLKSVIREKE